MRRVARRARRGATLIEALIALAALAVGSAGVVSLLTYVTQANRRAAFQNRSLEIIAELSTQIRDVHCDIRPDGTTIRDPGLAAVTHAIPIAASGITLVGDLGGTPPIRVQYVVSDSNLAGFGGPPGIDIDVQIREIMNDPNKDDPTVLVGYWIRTFVVKKVCNFRLDDAGRGEFY